MKAHEIIASGYYWYLADDVWEVVYITMDHPRGMLLEVIGDFVGRAWGVNNIPGEIIGPLEPPTSHCRLDPQVVRCRSGS